ncbi:MAG: thioesterase family protein [Rhodopseudomonas sp.]|uniref:acyl-CoA thioesterase n=1 Tax=Rhodopseudomonas sp. TaxID=1078 RepID=UPI0017BEABCF|nr:thioesterase family protein [Rhodopseudomonas sp.]NVN88147.1 thioesterase family protein [Rhodopseudomonas sp.]
MHAKVQDGAADPFDFATRVTPENGRWIGHVSDDYRAFVGPFGGVTAATMLRALLDHPERAGDPLAFTVNFCAPIGTGPFDLDLRLIKANRSSQHWSVELTQGNDDVLAFATAVFALRRSTWSHQPAGLPDTPSYEQTPVFGSAGAAPWIRQFEFRFVESTPKFGGAPHDAPASAHTKVWIGNRVPRKIDAVSLAAIADAFFARIFHVRGEIVPFGTMSMTTYFHADAADLAAEDSTAVLGVADAKIFHKSYADQTGELWSAGGRLLASTHQIAYFKV